MDTLSVLLLRLGFSADIFFRGAFCGSNHFPVQPTRGHLHLLRQGTLTLTHDDGTPLQLEGPAVAWYPRPHAHGLSTGGDTAELLCASVHLASDDAMVRALPDCLHLDLAQLPALSATLALLFEEAQLAGPGHELVLKRLCEILLVQLLRHALQHKLISATTLPGVSDAALARPCTPCARIPVANGRWPSWRPCAACRAAASRASFMRWSAVRRPST